MKKFRIYYCNREFARVQGDPCLGEVEAETKEDAERIASEHGLGGVGGAWAVQKPAMVLGPPAPIE